MNISKLSVFLLAAALLGSTAAFAGDTNKTTIQVYEKISLDGKALNPGRYTFSWEGSGPSVQVTVLQGKQTLATVPAQVVEQPTRNNGDGYGSTAEPDGSRALTAIYVGGKRIALEFTQAASAQPADASAAK